MEWIPAPSAFTFLVPTPAGHPARFVGIMRAPVRSAADVIAALGKLVSANLSAARRRGQISHGIFVRPASVVNARPASNTHRSAGRSVAAPTAQAEILTVDFWLTLEGLHDHYGDATAVTELDDALAGPLTASAWEQVSGFSEW